MTLGEKELENLDLGLNAFKATEICENIQRDVFYPHLPPSPNLSTLGISTPFLPV